MKNLHLTLEQLEVDTSEEVLETDTTLVKTCKLLRKKRLQDFTIENLRIMIGQQLGLNYLIPLAIDKLSHNILHQGDFYPGDLFVSILRINQFYWSNNRELYQIIVNLINTNTADLTEFSKDIEKFKSYKF